jgi:hypothetical protein
MEMNECLDLPDPRHEELDLSRLKRAVLLGTVVSRDHNCLRVPNNKNSEHCRADRKHDFDDDTPTDVGELLLVNRMLHGYE